MGTKELKAAILDKKNLKKVPAATKAHWGMDVTIVEWDGPARDKFESFCMAKRVGKGKDAKIKDMVGARGLVAFLSVIDPETDEKVFSSAEEAGRASGKGLDAVFKAASELNDLGEEQMEEARADLGKAPGDASSTDSPSPGAAQ